MMMMDLITWSLPLAAGGAGDLCWPSLAPPLDTGPRVLSPDPPPDTAPCTNIFPLVLSNIFPCVHCGHLRGCEERVEVGGSEAVRPLLLPPGQLSLHLLQEVTWPPFGQILTNQSYTFT